jgi:hypothetical protein
MGIHGNIRQDFQDASSGMQEFSLHEALNFKP